jgi:hypothetical protein
MNRAVHASATQHPLVGGVDDRVNVQGGDVAANNLNHAGLRSSVRISNVR